MKLRGVRRTLQLLVPFILLIITHYHAAVFLPIADCDETYNFWEPIHQLLYGSGLQTWENCSIYALRSWLFAYIYTAPGFLVTWVSSMRNVDVYFAIRVFHGCAACLSELFLVSSVWDAFNGKTAMVALVLLLLNYPIPHASVSVLPTSFVMINYFIVLGFWLRTSPRQRGIASGSWAPPLAVFGAVFFVVCACAVGWPFAGLAALPIAFDLLLRFPTASGLSMLISLALVVIPAVGLDTLYYCRPTWSSWNLVMYNIFGGKERGPELYGTEPWYFFVKNLLLNAHIMFLAGVAAPLVVLLKVSPRDSAGGDGLLWSRSSLPPAPAQLKPHGVKQLRGKNPSAPAGGTVHAPLKVSRGRVLLYMSPFFLWFGFWLTVPHKEERFMAPGYPFLVLSAAVCFTQVFFGVSPDGVPNALSSKKSCEGDQSNKQKSAHDKGCRTGGRRSLFLSLVPSWRLGFSRLLPVTGFVLLVLFGIVSFSRGMAIYYFYAGPQRLMYDSYATVQSAALAAKSYSPAPYNVCVGKEWYRFPSSFFLDPTHARLAFFKSRAFSGALPLPFAAGNGTEPASCRCGDAGVNDLNKEIPAQYVRDLAADCGAILESHAPSDAIEYPREVFTTLLAPTYRLLDVSRTPTWCRVLYYPFGVSARCAVWRELELRGKGSKGNPTR